MCCVCSKLVLYMYVVSNLPVLNMKKGCPKFALWPELWKFAHLTWNFKKCDLNLHELLNFAGSLNILNILTLNHRWP